MNDGFYHPVCEAAERLEGLDLATALELVLDTAEEDPDLYDALSVRWIIMAIEQHQLKLRDAGWAACRFDEHLESHRDAGEPLRKLLA